MFETSLLQGPKLALLGQLLVKFPPAMKTTEDILISSDLQEAAKVPVALNKLGRLMQKKLFFACLAPRIAFMSKWPWMLAQFANG